MRLIDADKLKEYILKEGFYCDTKADKEATAKEIDSLFPTIKAIPINWIMKYCYEKQEQYSITRGGFWLLWQMEVKKMIENWREENE